jgi:transcriptional regulator with XRE-family HTH domain
MADARPDAPERLRLRLRELGWTQIELAVAVGASPANVSRWLSGERTPSLDMAFRLQGATGITADSWVSTSLNATGTDD